jgi:hypothetical protein
VCGFWRQYNPKTKLFEENSPERIVFIHFKTLGIPITPLVADSSDRGS